MQKSLDKEGYLKLIRPKVGRPEIVDMPAMTFLMADGRGNPNDAPEFRDAIGALYGLGYTLKFTRRKTDPSAPEVSLAPLEALWWVDEGKGFLSADKSEWNWTAMIAVFGGPTAKELTTAVSGVEARAAKKKEPANPYVRKVRLQKWKEGKSAQVMHLGPYSEEGPVIQSLHAWIADQGYALSGKHHEIYISDPGRTAPAKMKTVIRQPISRRKA